VEASKTGSAVMDAACVWLALCDGLGVLVCVALIPVWARSQYGFDASKQYGLMPV